MQEKNSKRWLYLAVGFLGMFLIGIIYAWSIVKAPIAAEFGWDPSQMALIYTLSICFFCGGGVLAASLGKRVPLPFRLTASAVMILSGFSLTAHAVNSIPSLYVTYSFLIGGGIGISYNSLLAVVGAWFPDKKGTASGALMMGFGLSGLVFGKLLSALFTNPAFGWRRALTIYGIAAALVLFLCALVIRPPEKKTTPSHTPQEQDGLLFSQVVRMPSYWVFYMFGLLSAATGSTVIGFAQDLAVFSGASLEFAATMVGILSLCNGAGRIVCGIIYDVFGQKKAMFAFSSLTMLTPALVLIGLAVRSLPLIIVAFAAAGISYASCPTISSAYISSKYGRRDFALNYGVSNTKILFSSFAATISGNMLAASGVYTAPFVMLLTLAVLAFVLNIILQKI